MLGLGIDTLGGTHAFGQTAAHKLSCMKCAPVLAVIPHLMGTTVFQGEFTVRIKVLSTNREKDVRVWPSEESGKRVSVTTPATPADSEKTASDVAMETMEYQKTEKLRPRLVPTRSISLPHAA